jgi:hypothetical protein
LNERHVKNSTRSSKKVAHEQNSTTAVSNLLVVELERAREVGKDKKRFPAKEHLFGPTGDENRSFYSSDEA